MEKQGLRAFASVAGCARRAGAPAGHTPRSVITSQKHPTSNPLLFAGSRADGLEVKSGGSLKKLAKLLLTSPDSPRVRAGPTIPAFEGTQVFSWHALRLE